MEPSLITPLEAERHVLSAMLVSVDAVWGVNETMRLSDIVDPRHHLIAEAIFTVAQRDNLVGSIAVIDELERAGELNRAGGPAFVHGLSGYTPTATNAAYYARIVAEEGKRRRVAVAGEQLSNAAADKTIDVDQALDQARAALEAAVADVVVQEDADPSEEMIAALESVGTTRRAYPCRWRDINQFMHGFQPGSLYVIGARPSVGKSALALQFATDLAAYGHVGFFTLEMGRDEVRLRQLAQEAEISHTLLTGDRRLPEIFHDRAHQYALNAPPIMVDDRAVLTVADVRAQVRTWKRKYDLAGIVVDYLQLMTGDMSQGKVQMITEISRQLKLIAKEFGIVVIALSQLNRSSENRADKMPLLSDLRESGAIEQDADVVVLLHRDVMNTPENMSFILAKCRAGQTGILEFEWQGEFVRMF